MSYAIYGERGVVDIVAWHPGSRAILVIELKTDIVDVNQLIGKVDEKARLIRADRPGPRLGPAHGLDVGHRRGGQDEPSAPRRSIGPSFGPPSPPDARRMRAWLAEPADGSGRRAVDVD